MMDAKSEAEKRYPESDEGWEFWQEDRAAFLAGAAWALREFGDLLNDADSSVVGEEIALTLMGWGCDAHHIADGIEGQ